MGPAALVSSETQCLYGPALFREIGIVGPGLSAGALCGSSIRSQVPALKPLPRANSNKPINTARYPATSQPMTPISAPAI